MLPKTATFLTASARVVIIGCTIFRASPLPGRGTQLQVVAVGIGKVERRRLHPLVAYRTHDGPPLLLEEGGSALEFGLIDGEGEVLLDPVRWIFLEYDHSRGTDPEKKPMSPVVEKARC